MNKKYDKAAVSGRATIKEVAERAKVSQTLIDYMTTQHVLDELPDENQLSLFDNLF